MMSKTREIIVTTEETGQLWSACVWDPSTGTALKTYEGGGAASRHAACFLGNDYLLLSDKIKPILNAWPVNSSQPIKAETFNCTGKVNAMACTPNGFFCVTAIGKKLILWQMTSGAKLAVAEYHFRHVNCIKFTDDGSHFISGGEDGLALVWALGYLASLRYGESFPDQTEPRYKFQDNKLPIQDIYVGCGGIRARFVTVSLDKSCRLYDLSCGQLLATIIFSYSLSAVTMDAVETMILVGAVTGKIFQVNLGCLSRTQQPQVTDEDKDKVFVGHSQIVTCLSVSQDGTMLLSGSYDQQVIVWKISSREILQTIKHEGAITNAFFAMAPKQMFSHKFDPVLLLCSFQELPKGQLDITVKTTEDHCGYGPDSDSSTEGAVGGLDLNPFDSIPVIDKPAIIAQLREASKNNNQVYNFAMETLLETLNEETTKEEEERELLVDELIKTLSAPEESTSAEERNVAMAKLLKTLNISEEKTTNEEKRMEAEGESSNSKGSKCQGKKKSQQKRKVTKK